MMTMMELFTKQHLFTRANTLFKCDVHEGALHSEVNLYVYQIVC